MPIYTDRTLNFACDPAIQATLSLSRQLQQFLMIKKLTAHL